MTRTSDRKNFLNAFKNLKCSDYAYFAVTFFWGVLTFSGKSWGVAPWWLVVIFFLIALYFSGLKIYENYSQNAKKRLYESGLSKLRENDYEGSIRDTRELIRIHDSCGPSVYILLSSALFHEELYAEAIDEIGKYMDLTNKEDVFVLQAYKILGMSKFRIKKFDLNEAYRDLSIYLEGKDDEIKDAIVGEIFPWIGLSRDFDERILFLCNKIIETSSQGCHYPRTFYRRGLTKKDLNENDETYLGDIRSAANLGHDLASETIIKVDKYVLKLWTNAFVEQAFNFEQSSNQYKSWAYTDDDDENEKRWHVKFLDVVAVYFVHSQESSRQELSNSQLAKLYADFYVFLLDLECVDSRASLLRFMPQLDIDLYDRLVFALLRNDDADRLNDKWSEFYNTRLYNFWDKQGEGLATLEAKA